MTTTDNGTLLERALYYNRFGFNVIALGKFRQGALDYKAPASAWEEWQSNKQSEADVQALGWHGTYTKGIGGVSGVEQVRCLDFDAIKDSDGNKVKVPFDVVEVFCQGLGLNPSTYEWIVETGTGWHVWVRAEELPKEFFNSNNTVNKKEVYPSDNYKDKFKAIELRWKNHYTALPPSLHSTGKQYTFKNCEYPSTAPSLVDVEQVLVALEPLVCFDTKNTKPSEGEGEGGRARVSGNRFRNSQVKHTEEEVRTLLSYIPKEREHVEWKKTVAAVVASGLPEEVCVKLLEEWSPCSEGPTYTEVIRHKLERVNFGTLVYQAKQHGYEPQEPTKADLVQAWLVEHFELRYNELKRQVEFKLRGGDSWTCADDRTFRQWKVTFEKVSKKKVTLEDLRDYAQDSDVCTPFDPIRAYFDRLPRWDGEDHIGKLASCVKLYHEGTEETFNVHLKKWLVGTYTCGYNGGAHGNRNELFLVLQGKQGVFKTTFLRHLVPKELQEYRVDNVDASLGKDASSLLSKAFVHVDEELATMNKADVEKLKGLLSMEHFYFRAVYGRFEEQYPRRVSLCGSTNQEEFLRDTTGNRRFLVHKVEKVHRSELRSVDINLVWAQVRALHEEGYSHWLEAVDIERVEELNRNYQVQDLEEEALLEYFRKPLQGEEGLWLQPREILEQVAQRHDKDNTELVGTNTNYGPQEIRNVVTRIKVDNRTLQKVGALLGKHGFEHKSKKRNGESRKCWHVVPKYDSDARSRSEQVPF
jgi:predicted P-loop ATPase